MNKEYLQIAKDYLCELYPQANPEALHELDCVKKLAGKTVVVKYGGNAMINQDLKRKVLADVALMQELGVRVVLVHGGGPEINNMLSKVGKKSEFVAGLRVTDEETMELAEMVLVGKTNTSLVAAMSAQGVRAVGLNGKDGRIMLAQKHFAEVYENNTTKQVDIGFVGEVYHVTTDLLEAVVSAGYIPVIAPIAMGENGDSYNINADTAAGDIAGALAAEQLILLTDTKGIYSDFGNEDSFINRLEYDQAVALMHQKKIDGGMIPKVKSCVAAINGGTKRAYIIDGREPHSVLRSLFTHDQIGTEVVK